jgi:iron complex transport system substrate-binding protein
MRIVSLIASATEIVHSLGLGNRQVGRSHECDYPASVRSLPVCTQPKFAINGTSAEIDQLVKQTLASAGSVYDIFRETLERLQPTHILTQSQCKVCAVSLQDVEQSLSEDYSSRPRVVALEPNSLADLWNDIRRVADACDAKARGDVLVSDLQSRMGAISNRCRTSGVRPRVACIEWIEPLMAAGNWTPELVNLAGAENLFGEEGQHSPWIEWKDVVAADPDLLLIAPCGFDLERTRAEMHWLTDRPEWPALRAVQEGQVFLGDGNQFFNRPGPRVVETLEILAEICHPKLFAPRWREAGWVGV